MTEYIGVNPGGLGVATPRFWGGVVAGVVGGHEQVSEKTRAYFAQKLSFFRLFYRKEKN